MINFNEKCYSILEKVPSGKVISYKQIASKLNSKGYRAVGNAMNKNRNKEVNCHRVVCSDGKVGGYAFGTKNKVKILEKEGVMIVNGKVDLRKYGFKI